MDMRSLGRYARNPTHLLHRVRRALYERSHPGEPWMTPGAVRFCERVLDGDATVFEWGSGRSTTWFARRARQVTSIEHDAAWHARVREQISTAGLDNVDYRLIPLDDDKESGAIFYDPAELPAYVRVVLDVDDGSLDLAVVDGAYRVSCVLQALPKLRPGGYLLVDDAAWFPTLWEGHVPHGWEQVFTSDDPISSTAIWQKPR